MGAWRAFNGASAKPKKSVRGELFRLQYYALAIFVVNFSGTPKLTPLRAAKSAPERRGTIMDPTILAYVVQAVGGAIAGNILGAVTRGGGGIAGRTIIGALGGVALGYIASPDGANIAAVGNLTANWANLMPDDAVVSGHISNAITGAAGGGVLGLIGGLLIRPRP